MTQNPLAAGLALLDSHAHRGLRMAPLSDYAITAGMHCAFVAAAEFPQVAIEYPIVFVHDDARDAHGQPVLSPVAMFGVSAGENLLVEGTRWAGGYIPAVIRRYPFVAAPVEGSAAPGVFIDTTWAGLSETDGERLFDDAGQPTETLNNAIRFLQRFETEVKKTRALCDMLTQLELTRPMKADATLPDGENLSIDGFLTVDDARLRALPEARVVELHRNGMLPLLQAHLLSLGNLHKLLDRKARRKAG